MSSEKENKTVGKHQRIEPEAEKNTGKGIPFAVTILLVVLALACGCVAGYFYGTKLSDTADRLAAAENKISEYELLFAGFYTDEYEMETEAEEAARIENEGTAALTGENVIETESAEVFVVVEYDGGDITSDEARIVYEQALSDYAMMGEDVSESGDLILDMVLFDMTSERIAYKKAVELGLTDYSDAEIAEIDAIAREEYNATVNFYAGDAADEEAVARAQEYLSETEGYTYEGVRADIMDEYWREKLYAHVISGVSVDADDIAAVYSSRLSEQQARYDADPTEFENDLLGGEIVVYYPAGYRTVKQIYFALDVEDVARVAEINEQLAAETDAAVIESLNAELDSIYASAEQEANDVIAQFQGGADFDQLIAENSDYNDMADGTFSSPGFYISEKTVFWPAEFVEAAMALVNPGDISAPVRTPEGVYVVRFIANVEAGSVPLSNVSSRLTTETQEVMKEQAYDEQLSIWMEEANVQYYPERMR